jgi:hypothetical protein
MLLKCSAWISLCGVISTRVVAFSPHREGKPGRCDGCEECAGGKAIGATLARGFGSTNVNTPLRGQFVASRRAGN